MALKAGSAIPMTGAQGGVGLIPDVADGTVFTVLYVVGNHQRDISRPGHGPGLPSQGLKITPRKLICGVALNMALPVQFPDPSRTSEQGRFRMALRTFAASPSRHATKTPDTGIIVRTSF